MKQSKKLQSYLEKHGWEVTAERAKYWTVTAEKWRRRITRTGMYLSHALGEIYRETRYGGEP